VDKSLVFTTNGISKGYQLIDFPRLKAEAIKKYYIVK
jgi:hypothetical protein